MARASLGERLSSFGYIAGWKVTFALPQPVATWLFRMGADAASKNGKQPEQLRKNLARVVGEDNVTDELVRDSMRSYMRYWREAFQLPKIAGHDLANRVERGFKGDSLATVMSSLEEGKATGRGTILVLPHMGNWDMAGMWLVDRYGRFTTVAERLKPESLFDAFVEYRESLGFQILALTGSEEPPFQILERVLNSGGVIALLGDRDLTANGVPVEFFGETAFFPRGSALLAQRTGARLLTVGLGFEQDSEGHEGWAQHIKEITDLDRPVEDIVKEQARNFEEFISAHPTDWHMLQPLWARDLSDSRLNRLGFDLDASPLEKDHGKRGK